MTIQKKSVILIKVYSEWVVTGKQAKPILIIENKVLFSWSKLVFYYRRRIGRAITRIDKKEITLCLDH